MEINGENLNLSLIKAFKIIEFLASYGAPISVPSLSQKLHFNKTTTYNLLRTLVALQYIKKFSDGNFTLSSKILELGSLYNTSNAAVNIFKLCVIPLLHKYPSCNFSFGTIGTSMRGVYLSIIGPNETFISAGTAFPLHSTAIGKVILANSPEKFINKFFKEKKLTRYTNNTITDEVSLRKQFAKIRKDNYCLINGETFTDFHCIAVPIFNKGKHIKGAISIRSTENFIRQNQAQIIPDMILLGKNMSSSLGYNVEEDNPNSLY